MTEPSQWDERIVHELRAVQRRLAWINFALVIIMLVSLMIAYHLIELDRVLSAMGRTFG